MAPHPKTGPIDDAEAWLISTPDGTYPEASRRFGVTRNSLKARIENKYGSVAAARLMRDAGILKPDAGRILGPVRRCSRCGVSVRMDRNQRMCRECNDEIRYIEEHIGREEDLTRVEMRLEARRARAAGGGA